MVRLWWRSRVALNGAHIGLRRLYLEVFAHKNRAFHYKYCCRQTSTPRGTNAYRAINEPNARLAGRQKVLHSQG